jgi:predicted DNA-binding transcriptional regulator YafY
VNKEETKALLDFCLSLRNSLDNLISRHAPVKSIAELQAKIPSELKDSLTYEENQHYFIVRPRQYLGAENFAKILDAVRQVGGEYISKGKDSHFKVPKGQP